MLCQKLKGMNKCGEDMVMKLIRLSLFFCFFTLAGCSKTMINGYVMPKKTRIETISSMNDIAKYVSAADLIVFDIDNTLFESTSYYCHSNWFYDQLDDAISQGISEERALAVLLPPWEKSQKHCEVRPVESMTPRLVRKIQVLGKKVMALTSRSKNVAAETISELTSIGIDFSESAPLRIDSMFRMENGPISKNGVVFATDYQTKGDVLREYLKQAKFSPKRILFIDDSFKNLVSVAQVLGGDDISIHGFHYTLVKRSLPDWDKDLAASEWEQRHGKIVF